MGRPRTCSCDECPKCLHRIYMRGYYYRSGKKTYTAREKNTATEMRRYHSDPTFRSRKLARMKAWKLKPEPCAICGEPAERHHRSYDDPLDVAWLCREHHSMIHDSLPAF
jgi:hypothetical protein